jgi:hypothetical protein
MATARLDQTLALAIKGYAWLPDLRRRANGRPVGMRLFGRPAVAIGGPAAAQFFYEPGNVERPGDGRETLLPGDGVESLAKLVGVTFDEASDHWRGEISLFDEMAQVITDAVTRWSGVPREKKDLIAKARLVGFAAHAMERRPGTRAGLADDRYAAAFAQEVLRFYPSVPFLRGRAARDLHLQQTTIPLGTTILLDVYGQHHDPRVWPEPYAFRPERFLDRPAGEFELIPPGDGPAEQITAALLGTLAQRLAAFDHYLPPQDLSIDLTRMPARVHDGPRIVVPAGA